MVSADEAHRSQYNFIDGYARHMRDALPNFSCIGFAGPSIELQEANTRALIRDYIIVYDVQRALQDGATVPIYYESWLAKLALDEAERPKIDLTSRRPPVARRTSAMRSSRASWRRSKR